MAYLEFYLHSASNGKGIKIKAYKPKITEEDLNITSIQCGTTSKGWLDQDDLEQLKIQLDDIVLVRYGFFSYDLTYFSPSYSLGITSLGPSPIPLTVLDKTQHN